MTDDAKTIFLYAFQRCFARLCGGYRRSWPWKMGMWCNAHMYYALGVPAQEGARRFYEEIMSYASNRKELARQPGGVFGEFNSSRYVVYLVEGDVSPQEIYQAGNSPWESQGYLSPEEGVGLDEMRRMCASTTQELAAERKLPHLGVIRMEEDE